jgi:hypothetical protein
MKATKEQLITFLEKKVLIPADNHPKTTETIKRKIRATRMVIDRLDTVEKVEHYFWSAMATDNGIDSYTKFKEAGFDTFEDVRAEFKALCGRK